MPILDTSFKFAISSRHRLVHFPIVIKRRRLVRGWFSAWILEVLSSETLYFRVVMFQLHIVYFGNAIKFQAGTILRRK